MKQLILLVLSALTLSSAGAQSQVVKGTLLPKKGKSIVVLPASITSTDTTAVATTVKVKPTNTFIFTKPVVQGQTDLPKNNRSNTSGNQSPFSNAAGSSTVNTKQTTVQLSSTPGQIIPVDGSNSTYEPPQGPLKYEEPPISSNSSATKTDSITEYVSSLIYGPPPSTTVSNLRSPKILGLYKPSLNEPILLVPIALEDIEGNQPKTKVDSATQMVKTAENLYPRPDYSEPAIPTNLRLPKTEGSYSTTKNNPFILTPLPPDRTSANKDVFVSGNADDIPNQTPQQLQYQEPLTQAQKQPLKNQTKIITRLAKTKGDRFNNKFQSPVKQSTQTPATTELISKATVIIQGGDQPTIVTSSIKSDYKFYLMPNGSYDLVFDAYGSSISVTSFGRIKDFTLPSTGNNIKPAYNYRGMVETVGNFSIQYNYEGRIAAIGATQINYNYSGVIEKVGDTPIYYNYNGTVDKIGISKIAYDYQGNITNMDKNPMILVKQ